MQRLSSLGIAVVVLAAGRGTRMGGEAKLLLPMPGGTPLLRRTVEEAAAFQPSHLVVVVRPDLPGLTSALSGLPARCVPNSRYTEGMGTSIAAGIACLGPDIQAALVMLGDQPYVSPVIIEKLVAAYAAEGKPITAPLYGSRPGPPTLFARVVFPDLLKLTGDTGGRQLITSMPDQTCLVPFAPEDEPPDVDTPADYRSIL